MPKVPFYSNTPNDTHCFQASLRSVLKYFEPSRDFTWDELDRITNKPKDMWTWPMAGLSWLAEHGYSVIDIEPFDYGRFINEGREYMETLWGKDVVIEQAKHSDISLAQTDSKKFVETVTVQNKIPSQTDIQEFLNQGCLVICMLNASKLNQKRDFVGHSVLVIGHDQNGFTIHDPGLPALENRHVPYPLFEEAWGDPNDSAKNLAAIKLSS